MPPWTAVTLQRSLVDVLAGRALGESDTPGEPAAASVAPAHVVGRYRSPSLGVLTLEQAAGHGRLRMRIGDGLAFDVFQVGRAIFYVPGLDHWLAFSGERPPASFRLRSMYLDEAPTRVGDDAPGASR